MVHTLTEQHFSFYEDIYMYIKKRLVEWFATRGEDFYWHGIHKWTKKWVKCIISNGAYFE
jgi:hypothetical protein